MSRAQKPSRGKKQPARDKTGSQTKPLAPQDRITLYGRHVALDILKDQNLRIYRLHLCKSNREQGIINEIKQTALTRGIDIRYHDKLSLSRISKNARQDQGVAIDIQAPHYFHADQRLSQLPERYRLLAVDGIHNPANLGMIIRSACAGAIDALILPGKNCASLSPLVYKASAATLFRLPIYHCDTLAPVLDRLKQQNARIYTLDARAPLSVFNRPATPKEIFVLGNEQTGCSQEVLSLAHAQVMIPMNRGVESLNVAITAAILAFLS